MACDNCGLRKSYEQNPRSLRGRFWRWHTRFCPGWKKYMQGLDEDQRQAIKSRYNL